MTEVFDWDPRSKEVLDDQMAVYDRMRARCPVARSRHGYTSLLRHADVLRALCDPETFSNVVSRHPSVPNGMDPPQHAVYRALIDPYFEPDRLRMFEPVCRDIARQLAGDLPLNEVLEFMGAFAWEFAVRAQCAFMGWPASLHAPLRKWIQRNHAATLAIDADAMGAVAREFDGYVRALLAERRLAGDRAPDDVTTRLLRERIDSRPLDDTEIISIARNWTAGELSTIAASVGILMEYLATHPALQDELRREPALLSAAIDEILRIHGPLVMSRRRVMNATVVGERRLEPSERVALVWPSANRDEAVFGDPDEFRLDRDPALNLLYGAGIHVCPGAPLARLELRVAVEELLAVTPAIRPVPGSPIRRARFPASGFSTLPLLLQRQA